MSAPTFHTFGRLAVPSNEPAAGVVVYSSTAVVDDLDDFFVELEHTYVTSSRTRWSLKLRIFRTKSCSNRDAWSSGFDAEDPSPLRVDS